MARGFDDDCRFDPILPIERCRPPLAFDGHLTVDDPPPTPLEAAARAIKDEIERVELLHQTEIQAIGWELAEDGPVFYFRSTYGVHRIPVTQKGWHTRAVGEVARSVARDVVVQVEWRRRNRG
jgi:hypothetical protein